MDPSQPENRGRQNQAPTAAQPQAFANSQNIVAGQKRVANEVADLEIPESSRPMLGLDKTRHRPNHPKFDSEQKLSSDPGTFSSLPTINAIELSISHPHVEPSSAPLSSSSRAITLESASDVIDSAFSESSTPSNSHPIDPETSPLSPISSMSILDRRSPAVQALLREAFHEGRAVGLRVNEAKLDEAEEKIEELRKKLDPAKVKAAYDRGWRDGGIAGFNKYSLNPETKPNDDRLAFENICKEKDKAIHDQQLTMAKYQKELMARRSRIEMLERQVNLGTQQPPTQQQGENITGQQILDAEARFSAQRQELEATKAQNQVMRADLANWQVQWGLITADLEKWKAAFNTMAGQLEACQRGLSHSNSELQESKAQANKLAVINSVETGSLKAATKELKSKLKILSFDFNSLDRLYTTLVQVAAERSAETESVKEKLGGTSKKVQDSKNVTDALMSNNNELTKLRKQLEEKVGRQAEEIESLSEENEELQQKLRKREEEDIRAPRDRETSPSQAIDNTAVEIDAMPTNMAQETVAANIELVRNGVEREQRSIEVENLRREYRVTETLEAMGVTERRRRQLLMDELEDKDAQLYDAQKQIRDLTESILAATPAQPSPTPPSAPTPSSSSLPPGPSPPPLHSSSPPPETLPSSTENPPPTIPTSSAAPSHSFFRLPRTPIFHAPTNTSPRRLFIILSIFLLAFFIPFLRTIVGPSSKDINSQQVTINILPEVEVVSRGEDYDVRRRQWGARAMGIWERNERMASGEVLGWADEEYRPIPGWDY